MSYPLMSKKGEVLYNAAIAANPTHLASFVAALADFARALPIWVWVGWALGNPIRVMVERVVVAPDKFKGACPRRT